MRPPGTHIPGAQSRARLFDPADQRQTGSPFSPSLDAFHPCFPASVDKYISEPCQVKPEDLKHGRPVHPNASPRHVNHSGHDAQCQVNNASANGISAEVDCATGAHHCRAEGHGDNPLLDTSGPIFNLPPKVSDLVLSFLSPAALDAARHTCKDWRINILFNTWVLSSVLGVNEERSPFVGSPSGNFSHQDLLKKLDRDSDLPSTFQHPDAWRTRFRARNLDFSISSSSTRTRLVLVAAARTGTQHGWLAFQLRDSAQDTTNRPQSTLIIYRFDSAELPWYAGAVHNVEGQGALRITSVTEIRPLNAWVLQIEIGDATGLYSVTVCDAFSNSDSTYSLKTLESLEKVPGLSNDKSATQGFDRLPGLLPIGDQYWNILAPFPQNEGLHHVCFSEGLRKHTEPRFLAEQTKTGNIYIVMGVGPSKKESSQYANYSQSNILSNDSESSVHYYADIALVSCPRPNSVYKNIAVAPAMIKDGSIRAAIVWQTADLEKPISELYIYDIPEAVYYEPCTAYSQNVSDSVSTSAEGISASAIPRSCRLIQGKRITSLDQHMGGTHPFSSLYRFASPQEIALGGLKIPHTAEDQEAYPRNVQYQKCFVWGPASSGGECTQISMTVFDFSFADPQRLHSLNTCGVAAGWLHEKGFHNIALGAVHCACALHDDGFRIVLPDTTAIVASKPAITDLENARKTASSSMQKITTLKESLSPLYEPSWSLWWPRKATPAPDTAQAQDVGSISRNDSLAREAALERRQEWLRGRILGMKRAGLTDFEIAELWNMSTWTQFGQVRKPEGWRELGDVDR